MLVPPATPQPVQAIGPVQRVSTRAPMRDVRAIVSFEDVGLAPAEEPVVAVPTVQLVLPIAPEQPVRSFPTDEDIIARAATHLIVAAEAPDPVVAAQAADDVGSVGANQRAVVTWCATHRAGPPGLARVGDSSDEAKRHH